MQKFLDAINKGLKWIFRILEAYSKIVCFGVVILICAQVLSRKFFNHSIIWSEEVVQLLMVWVAFIATAIGCARDVHIRITLLYNKFPKKLQIVCRWIEYFATIFSGLMLLIFGSKLVDYTWMSTLPTTKWPSALLYLMIPVGGFFMIYCTILHMFFPKAATVFSEGEEAPEELSVDDAQKMVLTGENLKEENK